MNELDPLGEAVDPPMLGRRGTTSVQAWHHNWTALAEALRAVYEVQDKRLGRRGEEREALERLAGLPLFAGATIPGDTAEKRGKAIERALVKALRNAQKSLPSQIHHRSHAEQAIMCWYLHVVGTMPIRKVASEFASKHLSKEDRDGPRDWRRTGWAADVRHATVRYRMWLKGLDAPDDYSASAGTGLRRIVDAAERTLRSFEGWSWPKTALAGDAPVPSTMVVPRQLPRRPPDFVDRGDELGKLDRWLHVLEHGDGETPGVMLIAGAAGVGKTALALHWLHGLADRFPDGALYVDLRGYGGGGPKDPGEVLGELLQALGAPSDARRGSLDALAATYRSYMAGRRMLVMLDDADSRAQVIPLLPGTAESVVVVTSRWRRGGLLVDGAAILILRPLEKDAAVELLTRFAGPERVGEEAEEARSLVELCGWLPIAIRIVGARLKGLPHARIAPVVAQLRDERLRLEELAVEDVSVRAAFDLSYRALGADAARMYRALGLLPGVSFDRTVAAVATRLPRGLVDGLLTLLVDASMLDDMEGDWFRFHELLRVHARSQAEAADSPGDREATVRRVLDWYLASATAADVAVMPLRRRHPRTYVDPPARPLSFDGRADALAWLERERENLIACVNAAAGREWHATAWQLVDAMWGLFLYHKHYQAWVQVHRTGVESARACGDVDGETMLLNHLGLGYYGLGRLEEAEEAFMQALTSHHAAGDRWGEATAHNSLGLAAHGMGRRRDAIGHYVQAVRIHRALDYPRGEALSRVNLGIANADLGGGDRGQRHLQRARRHLARARSIFAALPDPYNEGRALRSLGGLDTHAGRTAAAIETLEEALSIMREQGSSFEEAQVLQLLGDALDLAGDAEGARLRREQALELYETVGGPYEERLRRRLWERPDD